MAVAQDRIFALLLQVLYQLIFSYHQLFSFFITLRFFYQKENKVTLTGKFKEGTHYATFEYSDDGGIAHSAILSMGIANTGMTIF